MSCIQTFSFIVSKDELLLSSQAIPEADGGVEKRGNTIAELRVVVFTGSVLLKQPGPDRPAALPLCWPAFPEDGSVGP